MNTEIQLKQRLLKLFPINRLKDAYDLDGHSAEVISDIVNSNSTEEIYAFVRMNHCWTKQRIYMRNIHSHFPGILPNFPYEIVSSAQEGDTYNFLILPKVEYTVTLFNPLEEAQIHFLQPYLISITNDIVLIHATKLEKTMRAHFPEERSALRKTENLTEQQVIDTIEEYFLNNVGISYLDINSGVKYLWANDFVDGTKVQWRDDSSSASHTMDENLMFKSQYPDKYESMITQPLNKTLFQYLHNDGNFCEVFESDPTSGLINIPRFPKTDNQIRNVISNILANN